MKSGNWHFCLCITDPEVSHSVDLNRLLNQGIRRFHEFLSCHYASIIHQNADITCLSLHLHEPQENVCHSEQGSSKMCKSGTQITNLAS